MNKLSNMPEIKIALVAVSRDCFPMSLSENRRRAVAAAFREKYDAAQLYECPVVIENEKDMRKALDDINAAECNALAVYLGNFGPETPETLLAKYFDGPVMFAAAAEDECGAELSDNRGDAFCGMLNASYNLKLRGVRAYIPEYPVGTAPEVADMIAGFIPVARGIPVSCEVDIYGALSEYVGQCVSDEIVTLLDINNTVPADIYREDIEGKFGYTQRDTFMGFHCGNGSHCILNSPVMKYQKIMHRGLEPDKEPDITRGTLEGDIKAGDITFFRLHSSADTKLQAYAAQGEILPVRTRSFGTIGIFGISEMARFYRYVLIEKGYPHHGAVVFGHHGKALFDVLKYLGVEDRAFNRPAGMLYKNENPFK